MTTSTRQLAAEAAAVLAEKTGVASHDVALVMGSGWLPAVDALGEATAELSTTDLPGFAPPAVEGHAGKVRSVRAGDRNLLVFLGRTHFYEGRGVAAVVHGVRTAAAAGCRTIVLTNGCGGLDESWQPGTPVLISDHINLTATSPIEGANFVDLTDLYSSRLRALCKEVEPGLDEGVYVQFPGPHYETPAEIRMVRAIGGDLVGMSTVLEAIAAREAGHGGARHLAGHQPRRRHHRRAPQPRGGPRGRPGGGLPDGRPARRRRPEGVTGMRVLVTGAAGSIGSVLCNGLVDRGHTVVGLDLTPEPEGFPGEWATADCADPDAVEAVFVAASRAGGLDAVVHLAGRPTEGSLPEELDLPRGDHRRPARRDGDARRDPDRLREQQPRRGPHPAQSDLLTVDVRPRPDTFYGVAKVAAEALLSLYVDRYGIDAVSTRIGSFLPQPETVRSLSTWLSHDDAVRMFDAALTAPDPGFAVLYGVSANTRGWWDLEPGRALGYDPQDDAEDFAGQITADDEKDAAEGAHVGGPYATDAFNRPALDGPLAPPTP